MKAYFSHDEGARNDPKLVEVMMQFGHEGKSVYWDLVEMLYEQGGYLVLSQCKGYAYALRTSCELILSLVNEFGLFVNDGERFWSETALKRLQMRNEKAERRAAAGAKGGKAKAEREAVAKANAQQTHSNAVAMLEQTHSNALASKEKEIKENTSDEVAHEAAAGHPLKAEKGGKSGSQRTAEENDLPTFTADTWPGLTNATTFAGICRDLRLPLDLDTETYRATIQDKMRSQELTAPATSLRSWISSFFLNEKRRGELLTVTAGLPTRPTPRNELPPPGKERKGQVLAFAGQNDEYIDNTRRQNYQRNWPGATIHIIQPR